MVFKFLITDILLWFLILSCLLVFIFLRKKAILTQVVEKIKQSKLAVISGVILLFYIVIALADSIHFRLSIETDNGKKTIKPYIESVLDLYLSPWHERYEKTYSLPFDSKLSVKSSIVKDNQVIRHFEHLKELKPLPFVNLSKAKNLSILTTIGFLKGLIVVVILFIIWLFYYRLRKKLPLKTVFKNFISNRFQTQWLSFWLSFSVLLVLGFICYQLIPYVHLLGTDKVGTDVFYLALKSIRTAIIIGTVTTLILLPIAIFFGLCAGFFGGIIDDIIQYLYTTLNSIPGILLIASFSLLLSVFMSQHSDYFSSALERADLRLLGLCFILGITSWTSLCRLLRAEALKIKALDYVTAAKTLGSSNYKILMMHIFPNVIYLILITFVLDFSGLVLAETILSYVGIGVDPTMASWHGVFMSIN